MNLIDALQSANALDIAAAIESNALLNRNRFVMDLLSNTHHRLRGLHRAALDAEHRHIWGPAGPTEGAVIQCKEWPTCAECTRLRKAEKTAYRRAEKAWNRFMEFTDAACGPLEVANGEMPSLMLGSGEG